MKADEKAGAKEQEYVREAGKMVSDMSNKAIKNYEQAVRMGMKLQEEGAQWWSNLLKQAPSAIEWQKNIASLASLASDGIPAAQKRTEELMELIAKSNRQNIELMKKAVEVTQSASPAESQDKWLAVWSESVKAAKTNAEEVAAIATKSVDAWIQYARKHAEVIQAGLPKAA